MQLACLLAKCDVPSFIRFIICSRGMGNDFLRSRLGNSEAAVKVISSQAAASCYMPAALPTCHT